MFDLTREFATSYHRPHIAHTSLAPIALFLATLCPTTPTTRALCCLAMRKKKNDHEASSSWVKEENPLPQLASP
jgi:hypothetical protein